MSVNRKFYPAKTLSRREFLRFAGLTGAAAYLTACGQTTPAQEGGQASPIAAAQATPAEAAASAEKVTVSFWTPGGSDVFCQGFNTIAQNFEKVEPGLDISEVQCYSGDEAYNEVLLANIAAGNPPDSTILWTSPVAFAARNALEPLDELMAGSKYSQLENWPAGVLASCQFKGQTYGLPATAGTFGIFYNQEMFEARGISTNREDFPKTWDELRKLSKEFTQWNGDKLESAGFIPWTNPGDVFGMAVEIAIWSALNGSQLFDATNLKYTIDSEQNIEMMAYALEWLEEEYQGDLVKIRASGNWGGYVNDQGQPSAFHEGKLAMVVQGFWYTGDFYTAEAKFEEWNVAPFPVGPQGSQSVTGYWPNWLVIPKGSKHVAEAFKYLDYMAGEGIKVWFANIPDLPANKKVPPDLIPAVVIEKRGQEFAEEVTAFFRRQLDVATPMWTSPIQDFANDQIGRTVEQILSKTASPQEALAEAQKVCQAELNKVLAG
ncbi:MAG: substrate-binding domain-containing protein [Anaerolineae bacterium]|nr:substrate-binding domain-containing protein [Anaerolineae bacterium]